MQKAALYTSGAVFTVVAVAHVVRLITGIEIVVDGGIVPVWVSFLGALIAALLAVWMMVAARRS
jgi:lipopolysaccharide export LptBFGC system permease protein LptF